MKRTILCLFGFLLLMACEKESPTPDQMNEETSLDIRGDKVSVCHATGSETNPYEIIEVSVNAWINSFQGQGDAVDMDGDGYFHIDNPCSETDCDDDNADVNPGATEIPYDGVDNDCDPATPDDDLDGDGYPLAEDCDDDNADINPGADEICDDGIDNNCDGLTDTEDTAACDTGAEIGEMIEGGIVFYVAETPTDLDGDGSVDRGLVVSPVDLGGFGAPWGNFQEAGCFDTNIAGADGTAIGTGKQNTEDILAACTNNPSTIAASIASSYNGGGHTDWYLPSQDEMYEIWEKLADPDGNGANTGPADPNNLGGFANTYYWTSTEFNGIFNAYWQHLGNGSQWYTSKNFTFRVRAIRTF